MEAPCIINGAPEYLDNPGSVTLVVMFFGLQFYGLLFFLHWEMITIRQIMLKTNVSETNVGVEKYLKEVLFGDDVS